MKKFLFLLLPFLFAGCMNIDYVGKKFAPTENVRYVENTDQVPMDDYTLIGRFTVKARPMYHPYDVEEVILEEAREYGGDLLCLTKSGIDSFSVYTTNSQEFGAPKAEDRKISAEEKEKFGKIKPLSSRSAIKKRQVFHYLLYKKTDELNRLLGY